MGYSELSIPVDIPWKRLGVSGDMLDPRFGDLRFPAKWATSIAVFYHEPAEVDPAYCHRKIRSLTSKSCAPSPTTSWAAGM